LAEFDDIDRSLRLIIEPIDDEFSVSILLNDDREQIVKYFPFFFEDELKIKISNGIPKEVSIFSKDKSARFRIYYDRNYFFRNLPRNSESFKQITDRLSNDFTVDLSDIHAMIVGLARRNQELEEDINSEEDKITSKEDVRTKARIKPSKIYQCNSIISHIHKINRLYQSFCFDMARRCDYQGENLDENDDNTFEKIPNEPLHSQSDELDEYIDRLINFIDKILTQSVFRSEEENKNDMIVQAQSILIDSLLKGYHLASKERHCELIREKLERNLSKIDRNSISKDASIKLFKGSVPELL
jgi:hypothetical protein